MESIIKKIVSLRKGNKIEGNEEMVLTSQKSKSSGNLEMSEKQSFSEHSQKSSIFDDPKNFQSKNENIKSNTAINRENREINQGGWENGFNKEN